MFKELLATLTGRILKSVVQDFVEGLDTSEELQSRVLDPVKEYLEKKFGVNL